MLDKSQKWVFILSQSFGFFPISTISDPKSGLQSLKISNFSIPILLWGISILAQLLWVGGSVVLISQPRNKKTKKSTTDQLGYLVWLILGTIMLLVIKVSRILNRRRLVSFWAKVWSFSDQLLLVGSGSKFLQQSMSKIRKFFAIRILMYLLSVSAFLVIHLVIMFYTHIGRNAPIYFDLGAFFWEFFLVTHVTHTFIPLFFIQVLIIFFQTLEKMIDSKAEIEKNKVFLQSEKNMGQSIDARLLDLLNDLEDLVSEFNILYSKDIYVIPSLSMMQILAGTFLLFVRHDQLLVVFNGCNIILWYLKSLWDFCTLGTLLTTTALKSFQKLEKNSFENFSIDDRLRVNCLNCMVFKNL